MSKLVDLRVHARAPFARKADPATALVRALMRVHEMSRADQVIALDALCRAFPDRLDPFVPAPEPVKQNPVAVIWLDQDGLIQGPPSAKPKGASESYEWTKADPTAYIVTGKEEARDAIWRAIHHKRGGVFVCNSLNLEGQLLTFHNTVYPAPSGALLLSEELGASVMEVAQRASGQTSSI